MSKAHYKALKHSAAHPGFAAVQKKIAAHITPRPGETAQEAAGAILASKSRGASAAAKKRNPRLKRVRGG